MKEASGAKSAVDIVSGVLKYSQKYNEAPTAVTQEVIANLMYENLAFTTSTDPRVAAQQIRSAGEKIAILPLEHRITYAHGNKIIKNISGQHYLNLDAAPVLRESVDLADRFAQMAGKEYSRPDEIRLNDRVMEMTGMYPYFQQKAATNQRKGKPAIGFYWTPQDGRPRFTTWMRCIKGHTLYGMYVGKAFDMELEKKIYADTIRATVPSQTHPDKVYDFWIKHLPIFEPDDRRQHSQWRWLETTDNNPDSGYRAGAHKQRKRSPVLFTSYAVAAFDAIAVRIRHTKECDDRKIMINPFPQLTPNGREILKRLRNQTLIINKPLNVTEMDRIIGADTDVNGYDHNFTNWTNRQAQKNR
ncbi:hypothetical protein K9M79_07920 [Candidatus Woesearchaeota archaeon]|nr:hypothetical protein [Candidatus Woesearchaeota archaeon]